MIRMIGFCGKAGAGKSTAAKKLLKHGFQRGKFAGALKEMLRALLRYRGTPDDIIERMIEGDLKEVPSPYLNGRTPRYAMQRLGGEWGRGVIDEDLWVDTESDHWAAKVPPEPNVLLVFDDVRHENEVATIRRHGGIVIRIERDGAGSKTNGDHVSEALAFEPDLIVRNAGSVADFTEAIANVLADYAWCV